MICIIIVFLIIKYKAFLLGIFFMAYFIPGYTMVTLWVSSLGQSVLVATALAVEYTQKILKQVLQLSFSPKMATR